MFRHVPECPGMFHVPGFIDGPEKTINLGRTKMINKGVIELHIKKKGK